MAAFLDGTFTFRHFYVFLAQQHPSFVFYLPFTRLWQFLAGSALAYVSVEGWPAKEPSPCSTVEKAL